jgi:predicted DNA-binding transcriptional regulator AlpA
MNNSFPDLQAANRIEGELLTLGQCAKLCQVSPRSLWSWARNGTAPPPLKIGKGTVRYSRREYVGWIAGGCKPVNGGADHE